MLYVRIGTGVPPFDGAGSFSLAMEHWQSPTLLCSAARLAAAARLSSSHDLGACALPLPARNKCEFKTFITYTKGDRRQWEMPVGAGCDVPAEDAFNSV